jgi:excinuclease UvrABC nuclease subunit
MRERIAAAAFPDKPGVYVVYGGDDRPLYVGVAATQSIAKRWRQQHLKPRSGAAPCAERSPSISDSSHEAAHR